MTKNKIALCEDEIQFARMYLVLYGRRRVIYSFLSYFLSIFSLVCIAATTLTPSVVYGLLMTRAPENEYRYYHIIIVSLTSTTALITSLLNFFSIKERHLVYLTRQRAIHYELITFFNQTNGYTTDDLRSRSLLFKRINIIRGTKSVVEIGQELANVKK